MTSEAEASEALRQSLLADLQREAAELAAHTAGGDGGKDGGKKGPERDPNFDTKIADLRSRLDKARADLADDAKVDQVGLDLYSISEGITELHHTTTDGSRFKYDAVLTSISVNTAKVQT